MAKFRRTLRKVISERPVPIDEQLWVIYVALAVLCAFVAGSIAAYLPFDEPIWYRNATTWLLAVPIVFGLLLLLLRNLNPRTVRRTVQLVAILSLLFHFMLLLGSLNWWLLADQRAQKRNPTKQQPVKRVVTVPEYHAHHFTQPQDRPQQEYEKPVETNPPEPEKVEPETQDQTQRTPDRQEQLIVVPESTEKIRPDITARRTPNSAEPRADQELSKFSRQQTRHEVTSGKTVEVPRQEQASGDISASSSQVAKQQGDTLLRSQNNENSQVSPHLARQMHTSRQEVEAQVPQTSATATARRQVSTPSAVPLSQVESIENPAVSLRTAADSNRPQAVASEKSATSSPDPTRPTVEILPPSPTQPAEVAQRREQPIEVQVTVAQTPTPSNSQRARVQLELPSVTTSPRSTPLPGPSPDLQAQNAAVARGTNTDAVASRDLNLNQTPDMQVTGSPGTRRDATGTPTSEEAPAVSALSRNRTSTNQTPSAVAVPDSTVASSSASSLAATSVASRKQQTNSPEIGRTMSDPQPVPATTVDRTNVAAAARQESNLASPILSTSVGTTGRTNLPKSANIPTEIAQVNANQSPQSTAELQPTSSNVTVRRSGDAQASPTMISGRTAETANSPLSQTTSMVARRLASAESARLDRDSADAAGPSRTERTASVAVSPLPIESPQSSAVGGELPGETAQPTRLSLNRGENGVAGSGQSPNLDRNAPGLQSPALLASGSARRIEATQTTLPGPSLSPSAPAAIGRSVAAADRPATPFRAETLEQAEVAGSTDTSSLSAASSASRLTASSDARQGTVSAAAGNVEVDLGQTKVVSEPGAGRVSGGGLPQADAQLPIPSASQLVSRSGARSTIAATNLADIPAAPGGSETNSTATRMADSDLSALRTTAGGQRVESSNAAAAAKALEDGDQSSTPIMADRALSRVDLTDGGGGAAARSSADAARESGSDAGRRIGRTAAGGSPQMAASAVASTPVTGGAGERPENGGVSADLPAASDVSVSRGASIASGQPNPTPNPTPNPGAEAGINAAGGGSELAAATTVRRAEAIDAAAGHIAVGGGSVGTTRANTTPALPTQAKADLVSASGGPDSSGSAQGAALAAQGLEVGRVAGGVRGESQSQPTGAVAGDVAVQSGTLAVSGSAVGERNAGVQGDAGPVPVAATAGGPLRRASADLSTGTQGAEPVDLPASASGEGIQVGAGEGELQARVGNLQRESTGGARIDVAAPDGPGGLGDHWTSRVGIERRAESPDEVQIRFDTTRFTQRQGGGVPKVSTNAVAATSSFRSRIRVRPMNSGPDDNDMAIERGLAFLIRQQRADGSWTLKFADESAQLQSDAAATGLAVLAFQGANYNHRQDKYQTQVRSGLDFLVRHQREDGDLYLPSDDQSNQSVWLYSHSIAALAICEAYGMTQDPALREPAQRAVNFIVAAQNKQRGGWRYAPGIGADTSVSGWMVMALESGKRAGLEVSQESYALITRWLDAAQASGTERFRYRYNPWAPDSATQRHGRETSRTMTAVGLLMRLYSGWKPDDPDFVRGTDYLAEMPPRYGTASQPERDTYYWYYASQVMLHRGGESWERWQESLFPMLRDTQRLEGPHAGSWDPGGPIPDRWAVHAGRIYVTTLNLLSLEVKNRSFSLYEH